MLRPQQADFDLLERLLRAVADDDAVGFEAVWSTAPFAEDPDLRQRLRVIARTMSHGATAQTRVIRRSRRADLEIAVVAQAQGGSFRELIDLEYVRECATWAYRSVRPTTLRLDVYVKTQISVCAYVLTQEARKGEAQRRRLFEVMRRGIRRVRVD